MLGRELAEDLEDMLLAQVMGSLSAESPMRNVQAKFSIQTVLCRKDLAGPTCQVWQTAQLTEHEAERTPITMPSDNWP